MAWCTSLAFPSRGRAVGTISAGWSSGLYPSPFVIFPWREAIYSFLGIAVGSCATLDSSVCVVWHGAPPLLFLPVVARLVRSPLVGAQACTHLPSSFSLGERLSIIFWELTVGSCATLDSGVCVVWHGAPPVLFLPVVAGEKPSFFGKSLRTRAHSYPFSCPLRRASAAIASAMAEWGGATARSRSLRATSISYLAADRGWAALPSPLALHRLRSLGAGPSLGFRA